VLDHKNGNSRDNDVENLRYLCPNCESQLDTRGGANKGRVQNRTDTGYELYDKETGRRDAKVIPQGTESLGTAGHIPATQVTIDDRVKD